MPAFVAALGLAAGCLVPTLRGAERRPNILFCISDDQSWPHASAYGCTWVKTPAFDRVAREGLLFQRAYTPSAKCSPSRAAILTGRNHWLLEAAANHGGDFPADYATFVEALGRNGYMVGYTAKGWGPGNPGEVAGKRRELTGRPFNAAKTRPPTTGISPFDYAGNFAAFLQARPAGQPFCFWYGCFEPHRNYERGSGARVAGKTPAQIDRVPRNWPDEPAVRGDMLDYALEVEYFDQHLARMLEQLEAAGEADNTIVVVTSDNGMPFPRGKGANYDLSHHLPLAIRWPRGIAAPGRSIDSYVSVIDFAPTFLEVAGIAEQASGLAAITGRSLVPLFRDTGAPADRRFVLIGQERHDVGRPDDAGYPVRGVFAGGFLYLKNFEPSRWPMCDPITGYLTADGGPTKSVILAQNRQGINHWRWELNFGRKPAEELYDLRADPDGIDNLAANPALAGKRKELADTMTAALREQHDPRMEGKGDTFDRFPNVGEAHDFYNRYILKHEPVKAGWASPTDFEDPGFDPERPLQAMTR